VTKDLERMAKDYPGVRIDLNPLPAGARAQENTLAMTSDDCQHASHCPSL
jgi:hypothetical protein